MIRPIRNMRGAVVVWLVSYILFLLTLANNFSASHDSINYILHISKGEHLFHQHHLLYHFLANKWMHLIGGIFSTIPQHYVIESFTALWGSLNLAICYLFFRNRFNLPLALSVAGIAVIAFSFGSWFYSVNIEVYAPPIFFILCCLYVISEKEFKRKDVVLVAVLHSFAVLFHQLNVLFSVVVFFWFFSKRSQLPVAVAALKYASVAILLCGAVYFYAGWYVEKQDTPGLFANWVMGYTKGHSYWQPLSFKTPVNVAVGFARAFIGAHFAFELPFLKAALQHSFSQHGLRDEMFLVRNVGGTAAWLLTILALLIGGLLVMLVLRFARRYKAMSIHYNVINPLLLTIAVYSLFFCFWMPEILEFWILQMILVWLLVVGMLPLIRLPFRLPATSGVAMLAISLFVVNYFGSIKWLRDFRNDWYYVETQKLDSTLTAEDIVILEDEWILKDYVRYYSKATVVATDEPGYSKPGTEELIKRALAADRRIYVHKKDGEGNNSWVTIQSY